MRRWLLGVLVVCLSACQCGDPGVAEDVDGGKGTSDGGPGGTSDGGVACIEGLESVTLTPADSTVSVGTAPTPIAFTATGHLTGGRIEDVTQRVTWSSRRDDDSPAGTFSTNGQYEPAAGVGGHVRIEATDGCKSGSTTLTLRLDATFQDPGPAVADRFAGPVVTSDPTKAPKFIYPSDQTRFPRNIYKTLFQWKSGGNDFFRLTFEGPFSKTVVYSDGKHPQCAAAAGSGCFESDAAVWQAIAGSNAGELTRITIDGVTAGDSNVYRGPSIEIGFSRRDVKGAIFYWSTTAAGIRRASVSDENPEAYVVGKPTPTQLEGAGTVKCVACHTVSRSGQKLFGYTEAGKTGGFVYDVTLNPPPLPVITTQITTRKGFGTFRPDDARVVATVGDKLAEFDANTGARYAELPVLAGTNPDWSPLTTELVYSNKGGDSPGGAALNVISYENETWGAIRELVPAAGNSNLFPSYSPDGAWVAYGRGKGGHGDLTMQLHLIKADGSGQPVELVNANKIVNGEMTSGLHENNMPTWAPSGDFEWVAFNSVRPYGVVHPKGGTQQIWVAAIDRSKLGTGQDPSFPAFRFAFQGLTENNHRAFWTLDVRDPPDGGSTCASLGESCAGGETCCLGTECRSSGELGEVVCQLPLPDGGMCIPEGGTCDQTAGDPCCSGMVCDVGAGGGTTVCRTVEIN